MEPEPVADRLTALRSGIASLGVDPATVRIVAVTKGFGADAVVAARDAGCVDIGENYAQELLAKAAELPGGAPVRWHFLGHIQRNKVRALAATVDCWQGLSRRSEAEEIARRRPGASVLVEVDTTGAPGRGGCPPAEVAGLVATLSDLAVTVDGLMTVAPREPDAARSCFRQVRALADGLGLAECSMGMSDDWALAVGEGSTMIRVGRSLFGERPARPDRAGDGG